MRCSAPGLFLLATLCAVPVLAAPPGGGDARPGGGSATGGTGSSHGGTAPPQVLAPPPLPLVPPQANAASDMPSPDNAGFCAHLADMAAVYQRRQPTDRPEADALVSRGRVLCAAGRMRSGIWHLRRALRELRQVPATE